MAAPAQNFRALVESVSPPPFAGENSAGYYGAAIGLTGDILAEGIRLALLMPWLLEEESSDDVLSLIGAEVRMRRYDTETADAYRARLVDAFNRYANAGTPARINAEIAAAGLTGSVFFQPTHPGPGLEPSYWSQFWILTTHVDSASLDLMLAIAAKWKSVQWICRGFVFDFAGTLPDPIAVGDLVSVGEGHLG